MMLVIRLDRTVGWFENVPLCHFWNIRRKSNDLMWQPLRGGSRKKKKKLKMSIYAILEVTDIQLIFESDLSFIQPELRGRGWRETSTILQLDTVGLY